MQTAANRKNTVTFEVTYVKMLFAVCHLQYKSVKILSQRKRGQICHQDPQRCLPAKDSCSKKRSVGPLCPTDMLPTGVATLLAPKQKKGAVKPPFL